MIAKVDVSRISLDNPFPQLTLSEYLDAELDDLVDMIDVESYLKGGKVNPGHCQTEMENQKLDEFWVGYFLDYAATNVSFKRQKGTKNGWKEAPLSKHSTKPLWSRWDIRVTRNHFLS